MLGDFLKKGLKKSLSILSGKPQGNYKDHLYALVVVGGGGTRLWPKSRNKTPKQFLRLFNKKTLTQISIYRLNKILSWEKIFVITTSEDYKKEILREVPEVFPKNIIIDPAKKNTGPAQGLGALFIYNKDQDAVIINVYVDHLMSPEEKYLSTLKAAGEMAYSGDYLVAVGIKPSYPNVGYGYIKRGSKFTKVEDKDVYKVERFTEKPELPVAKKYLSSGDYFWNAGQYVWKANSVLNAYKKHAPEISKNLEIISKALGTASQDFIVKKVYENMPEISVDYAISEKAQNFLMIIADYQWKDIGDWNEVWEELPKDKDNNVVIDGDEPGGRLINIDTSNTLVHTDGRLIAIVDVDDIAIVDTKNILLVCKRSRAQSVKKIVEQLKKEKQKQLL